MTTGTLKANDGAPSMKTNDELVVALPEPGLSMSQDAEWCVVQIDGEWRQYRFHDYEALYSVPGLYEKIIYEILQCDSPRVVRELLEAELSKSDDSGEELRVLDFGAGNGMVGEELANLGVRHIVGVDIIPEAAEAAGRDRPGLYERYHVVDLTDLSDRQMQDLRSHNFTAMTCVAALGFGDIPTEAFATAFNLVRTGGWVAFNIKEDFLSKEDESGFSRLIRAMLEDGTLEIRQRKRYQHRLATDQQALYYVAIIGTKKKDISSRLLK